MHFKTFIRLSESDNPERKLAVFTFGRMNPPTKGHAKVLSAIADEASSRGGDPLIFFSRSHDPERNPLSPDEKLSFLRELFPDANFIDDATVRMPFSALRYMLERGYTDLVMVIGSDRMAEMEPLRKAALNTFKSCELVSAGERDADSDDEVGAMSATKARAAAASGDLGAFRAATGWRGGVSVRLMNAVREGTQNA